MRYIYFFILVLFFSCSKKDTSICYVCITTYSITTDTYVEGFPRSYPMEERLCDIDEAQIEIYEQTYQGTNVAIISGVTYTDSYSTECRLE